MERLTKKISKTVQDKYNLGSYLYYDFAQADDTNKLLNKLGKFEDFMEEMGFESIEQMKYIFTMNLNNLTETMKENQALKDRWEKLKEYVNDYINSMNYTANYSQIETLKGVLNIIQKLEKGE